MRTSMEVFDINMSNLHPISMIEDQGGITPQNPKKTFCSTGRPENVKQWQWDSSFTMFF